MMLGIDSNRRNLAAVTLIAAACVLSACSSDPPPPPDLTANGARDLVVQKWSSDELNHFKVTFHSDTLIECGVKNELWKLAEITDRTGVAWRTAYQLTERGQKSMTSIDLKESGRGHEIVFRGPYRFGITSITEGGQPNTRRVGFRWEIDWDKASDDLKACFPKFELSGTQLAQFELNDRDWRFVSYLNPDDAPPVQATGSVLEKLR